MGGYFAGCLSVADQNPEYPTSIWRHPMEIKLQCSNEECAMVFPVEEAIASRGYRLPQLRL